MYYMGIDVGSVSTDLVLMDEELRITQTYYLKTKGDPIGAIREGIRLVSGKIEEKEVLGVGTTGSGRSLAAAIVGADIAKNEITAHGVAAVTLNPSVKTILEIGGQDSKIILIRNGIISDFAMNTVCAAGTGSFLDRQAERLGIPIQDLGEYAKKSSNPVRIAGRCAVFAESDIIHKQQLGCRTEDLVFGMCQALARNYLSNVAKGKELMEPIFFQGGVASNEGIIKAFEEELSCKIVVPEYNKVMGAYGAAILAKEKIAETEEKTRFVGFREDNFAVTTEGVSCDDCENGCEVVILKSEKGQLGAFSDKCGKYQRNKSFKNN